MRLVSELSGFERVCSKFGGPIFVAMLTPGGLLVVAGARRVAPFIHTIF